MDQDAAEAAVAGEAGLEVPAVTLQAFAGLVAEDHGPEWEVPLTVAENSTQSRSTGGGAEGNVFCKYEKCRHSLCPQLHQFVRFVLTFVAILHKKCFG